MSVGYNRHYRVDEIRLRHFIQTAKQANVGARIVEECFAELSERMQAAMTHAASLDVPAALVESLDRATRARLQTT